MMASPSGEVPVMSYAGFRNQLLQMLSEHDVAIIRPFLEAIEMPRGMYLDKPGEPIDTVYFIEQGICSVVVIGENDQKTEAGHIGREGMTGSALAANSNRSPNQTMMQVAGRGLAMSSDDFLRCLNECPSLRTVVRLFG